MLKRKAESDPAPYAPPHPTTRTATKWKEGIKETGQCIADEFNKTGLLKHAVKFEVIKEETNNLKVKFSLTEDAEEASSAAEYWMKDWIELNGRGIGVESKLGSRTGQLLFNLTILLAILRNTSVFKLDNFTNDPVRAAGKDGLYGSLKFIVDTSPKRHCTPRDEFTGKSLAEQLKLAEGGMILKEGPRLKWWQESMMKMATKVDCLLGRPNSRCVTTGDAVQAAAAAGIWGGEGLKEVADADADGPIATKILEFAQGFKIKDKRGGKTRKKIRKTRKKTRKTRKKTRKMRKKKKN